MNNFKLIGLTIMMLLLALATPSGAVVPSDVGIRGEITRIRRASSNDQGRIVGTVLVAGDKKADESLDQANLIVTRETRIFEQRGDEPRRATFEDLKVGDTVEAKFVEGPTVMMYPLQVGAAEIVILKRGVKKQ